MGGNGFQKFRVKGIEVGCLLAFLFWSVMFCPLTASFLNFWVCMTLSCTILSLWATLNNPHWWERVYFSFSQILLGGVVAGILWIVFWLGEVISSHILPFARGQIDTIYTLRQDGSVVGIGCLLFFIIGPSEEIFWRLFVQKGFMERYGKNLGMLITILIYTLVHLASLNLMLILSALVVGAIWGMFYRFYPKCSLALILSHALWDLIVFCVFPL